MKFVVADTVKGGLTIEPLGRTFKAGQEFVLSEEESLNSGVQFALRSGMLNAENGALKSLPSSVLFKNLLTSKILVAGVVASPLQSFFIPEHLIGSNEVMNAISEKMIERVDESKKPKKNAKKAPKEEARKEGKDGDVYIVRPDSAEENISKTSNSIYDPINFAENDDDSFFADKKQEKERMEKLAKVIKNRSNKRDKNERDSI